MISVQNIGKSYGIEVLLTDVTFTINKGERVGLVGRNGSGKTTLFRMIAGEETPDEGEIIVPRGYRVGKIAQHVDFTKDCIRDEAALGLREDERDQVWKVESILMGLGFTVPDLDRPIAEFSGGYQMRLMLAKVLAAEPDMLLLDEPTNFLDIVSIRWLESFLRSWRSEFIIISHDRMFMDKVVTHTMGIHRRGVKKIAGGTGPYYDQIALEEEVHERRRINQEKQQRHMEKFITKFRAKARQANLVQSRIKALEKMEHLEKLSSIMSLSFSFPCAEVPSRTIARVESLRFGYGAGPLLIDGVTLAVNKGDKICIIGKNGKGKTTLIKLLAGDLAPVGGSIKKHQLCSIAYYEQAHTADLNPSLSIEAEMMSAADPGVGVAQYVKNVCGGMMFPGDLMKKKIAVLSGGEKSRVLLGKLLVAHHNLLLLDEPTQHLDMESCDAIMDAVEEFEGAAIIVTHDERFLYRVATKLIVFQRGRVMVFPGTYTEFLEQVGWEDEDTEMLKAAQREATAKNKQRRTRQERAELVAERARALKPLQERIHAIEKEISQREAELVAGNDAMIIAAQEQKSAEIQDLSKHIHAARTRIEELYAEWQEVNAAYDTTKKQFEEER